MENKPAPPRNPEKAATMYRGTILPLSRKSLDLLGIDPPIVPHLDKNQQSLYKGAAQGVHLSSDIKTARLYADAGSFISQQKSPVVTRDNDNWTIGVTYEIDNTENQLGAKIAKPQNRFARFDKVLSHHVFGRTEFVVPEIPEGAARPRELYLFRGDILHAKFNDREVALTAMAGHLKYLEAVKAGQLGQGEFIKKQHGAHIDRHPSSLDTDGFISSLADLAKTKLDRRHEVNYAELLAGKADELTTKFDLDWSKVTAFPKETLVKSTEHLADTLKIKSEFFDNPANSLMLFGLAESGLRGDTNPQYARILRELVKGYSDRLPATAEDPDRGPREQTWLDSVENPELTAELQKIFYQTDFLAEVKQELNITAPDTEDPFTLKVIKSTAAEERSYIENVSRDPEETLPPAYVFSDDDGHKTLVVRDSQLANLQNFLANSADELPYETRRDVAYIKHEYIHTQKSLLLGKDSDVGLALEEYRAERLSGNMGGYNNVKDIVNFIVATSDFNFYQARLDAFKNPNFSTAALMSKIATALDLTTMTNLMSMTQPSYEGFDQSLNTAIVEHITAKYDTAKYQEYLVPLIKDLKDKGIKYSGFVGSLHQNQALSEIIKTVEDTLT
jgi:hypothetical protein